MTSDVLSNQHIRVEFEPARGGEVRAVRSSIEGANSLAYYDWTTPTPATATHSYGDSELDWLSGYRGGWQETIPNAGSETSVNGTRLPFHGEGSALSWTTLASSELECTLQVQLRLPLTVTRTMRLHPTRATLFVETTITNDSPIPVQFVWGHHPCFPAFDETRVEFPGDRYTLEPLEAGEIASDEGRWPYATDFDGRPVDLQRSPDDITMRCFYLHGHDEGWAVIHQPSGQPSVAISWDLEAYPAAWLWQQREDPSFPWYGRMRVVALEPQSAWPYDGLAGAIERGQAQTLAGGESRSSWFTYSLLGVPPEGSVRCVTKDGVVRLRDSTEDRPEGGSGA